MAFVKGNQSTEGSVKKLYCGVGSFFVVGVNPTKAEQEKIFNTTLDKEPEYCGVEEVEGKKINTVRITFLVKSDPEKNDGIEMVTNHTFFLRNEPKKGSNSGKIQVVDAYGNFAWATEEDIKNKAIPQYSNGPANIDSHYRMAWSGEEELTQFLVKYLNIPSSLKWENGVCKGFVDNLQDCECRLDNIKDYFNGNFSELKTILSFQPNNKVKLAVGVKTTEKGSFQATFTRMALNNAVSNFDKLDKTIKEVTGNSSNPVDYTGDSNQSKITTLHEYEVKATEFTTSNDTESPFEF